jgi:HK97 family phage major capsid protein
MTPEEQAQKMESLLKISIKGQEAIQAVADNQASQKGVMEKVQTDLESVMTKQTSFEETVTAELAEIKKEQQDQTRSAFDIVLTDEKMYSMHGYDLDPINRALYKSHTTYSRRSGWHADGEGYEIAKSVADLNDMVFLYGMFKALRSVQVGEPKSYSQQVREMDTYKLLQFELGRNPELRSALDPEWRQKALNTQTSGQGAEWVPTTLSNQLVDDIRLALNVAGLFPSITIPMGTGTFEIPKKGARQRAYLVGEPISDSPDKVPAATPPSGKVSFSPVTHALRMLWSDDITEDAAIAMFPLVRDELVQALVDAAEDSIINGDSTDSTHFDSDVTSGNDTRKSYDGLRYFSGQSAGEAAVDISTLALATLRNIRKKMGKYGVNPMDTQYVSGISAYVQLLSLDEVETMEKFGPAFTAKNGTLAVLDGSGISVSEFMRQDCNASGVYDGVTTTKSNLLLVNTKAHWTADKAGGMKMESARDIESLQNVAVSSIRRDFKRVNVPTSGEATVGIGYNLTS